MKKYILGIIVMLISANVYCLDVNANTKTYTDVVNEQLDLSITNNDILNSIVRDSILESKLNAYPTIGYGIGLDLNQHELNIFYQDGTYYMLDTTRQGALIQTLDYQPEVFHSSNNMFNQASQRSGVTAHINMGQILDYFKNHFNRNGYSNSLEYNNIVVDYPNYSNAVWNGSVIILGEGDGLVTVPFANSLDILAHEFTHAFLANEVRFTYSGESGALEESLADTFAVFIDRRNFLIGEDVFEDNSKDKHAIRSLENPKKFNQPDNFKDYVNYPANADNDYGGVHINSGIPNKAAYLTIKKLGYEKTEQIYYHAVTNYFQSNSTFENAKKYLMRSAMDLYDEKTASVVEKSWNKVGI